VLNLLFEGGIKKSGRRRSSVSSIRKFSEQSTKELY
jgi:hypothetical protein